VRAWSETKLPPWITPAHYDIELETDVAALTFAGSVRMHLAVAAPAHFIAFHALNLDVAFRGINSSAARMVGMEAIADRQYHLLHFAKPLAPGAYALDLTFTGVLTDSLRGYYKSVYRDVSTGADDVILSTQFESTDARQGFPCLDEPALKATFSLAMTAPKPYPALGNMPLLRVEELAPATATGPARRRYVFDRTPRMSTYLVAYVVSRYEVIHGTSPRGLPVSVWTAPGKTELGTFALEAAAFIIDYFERSFATPYALPKLDLIAIPDFAEGAMENWGLVTYRDVSLLVNATTSSASERQVVASVVAHELAHQFFGNYVTMDWWSDLWLNEGFAEHMEYWAVHAFRPQWGMMEQFYVKEDVRAMGADASIHTHPIAVAVQNPDEIADIFDDVSYGKGSACLRCVFSGFFSF
jgi:aminopeptidase N